MSGPSRREALLAALTAGALLRAPRALAFGAATLVDIAELDLGPGTISRPLAWDRLLYDVRFTTSVETVDRSIKLGPADPLLFEHPFAVLLADGAFALPDEAGLEQLARYLSYGGFLVIDDTTGAEQSAAYESARALCARLFPTRGLVSIPKDHSIYRSFFLLDQPMGRLARFPTLEAVIVGDTAPVVVCRNDLSGALERGRDGRDLHACVPGGETQRREAIKLGINLILYSLTSNYKRDLSHVRELQRQRRLE